ncbi:putative nuclease HARBI1 [Temnothorax nylanderi]|uniref:putative nuclease HARBI1 n=1 Tax=Temnothorax nylanderi TaxID=102681 RepID=UPI003A89D124
MEQAMEQEEQIITHYNNREILTTAVVIIREIIDSSSDSSSESDDEELKIITDCRNVRRRVPRILNYVSHIIPNLTKEEFKAHFRMLPETFDYILSCIEQRLKRVIPGTPMIDPRTQFLLALWRVATPDSFRSICERFNWPTDDRLNEVWAGFENASGFSKIVGAIDGTHINIPAPKNNPECYINRKGHHSIQLQAICDHKCQFIHCYAGHVGSVHDQRVFRQSEVQHYLGDVTKFPQDSHLVGDSAYKLHENLLVPYRDNGHLTERQRNYNFCHSSARIVIERAFGLLKGRFRCLLTTLAVD